MTSRKRMLFFAWILLMSFFTFFLFAQKVKAVIYTDNLCCLYKKQDGSQDNKCVPIIKAKSTKDAPQIIAGYDPFDCKNYDAASNSFTATDGSKVNLGSDEGVTELFSAAYITYVNDLGNPDICFKFPGYNYSTIKGLPQGGFGTDTELKKCNAAIAVGLDDNFGDKGLNESIDKAYEDLKKEGAKITENLEMLKEQFRNLQAGSCCVPNEPLLGKCENPSFQAGVKSLLDADPYTASDPMVLYNQLLALFEDYKTKPLSSVLNCDSDHAYYGTSCEDTTTKAEPPPKPSVIKTGKTYSGGELFGSVKNFCLETLPNWCICKISDEFDCINSNRKNEETCKVQMKDTGRSESEWACRLSPTNDYSCPSPKTGTDAGLPTYKGVDLGAAITMAQLKKDAAEALNPMKFAAGKDGVLQLVGRIIKFLMYAMGSILLVLYIWSGILWMTSFGNSEKVELAKKIILWSTLGVVIQLSAYVIVNLVFNFTG